MATELQYQAFLVKAAEALDGEAFKMSNQFLAGIPDLFIQMPGLPTMLVEIKKWTKLPKVKPFIIDSGLTVLQRGTLNRMLKAGAKVGWAAIYREVVTDYIYTSADPNHSPTLDEFIANRITRKRGIPWTEVLPNILAPIWQTSRNVY